MPEIIIADDSIFQRAILSKVAREQGFEITEAKDGQECLDLVTSNLPQALILDLNMPVVKGIDVLQKIHAAKLMLPIIVLTADIQDTTRKQCLDLGASKVLLKPMQEQELVQALREIKQSL